MMGVILCSVMFNCIRLHNLVKGLDFGNKNLKLETLTKERRVRLKKKNKRMNFRKLVKKK